MRHTLFMAGWAAVVLLPIEVVCGQSAWQPQAVAGYGQAWPSAGTYTTVGGDPAAAAAVGPIAPSLDYFPGLSPNDSCGLCRSAWAGYCAEVHRIGCKDHGACGSACGDECGGACGHTGLLHGLHSTRRASAACCSDAVRQGCCGSQRYGNRCDGRCGFGVFRLFGIFDHHSGSACPCGKCCDECGSDAGAGEEDAAGGPNPTPPEPPSPAT